MANFSWALLSNTNRVEVPYIKITIGKYTFGTYNKQYLNETTNQGFFKKAKIEYPNYVQDLSIVKINGQVNEYTLRLFYPVRPGDDPNFFEKVFSSVSSSRKIIFTYGDMSAPEYVYRNEQAIITKISTVFNFRQARIEYTLNAVSSAFLNYSGTNTFIHPQGTKVKPSDEIKKLLKNPKYGLTDLFYGMSNYSLYENLHLIADNDQQVQLESKVNISIIDYLKYLVSCMIPIGTKTNQLKLNSFYILTIHDEAENEVINKTSLRTLGGPYFKVTQVDKNVNKPEAYTVTIGYPTANLITDFSIENNENFSLFFDYQEELSKTEMIQRLDDNGEWIEEYSPRIASNNNLHNARPQDKTWWSKVTEYPINASISIKGLLRPAMLMEYIKLDVLFHGQKHISSGLYIITKQVDSISGSGCRTTLSLTRVDAIEQEVSS